MMHELNLRTKAQAGWPARDSFSIDDKFTSHWLSVKNICSI